MGGGQERCSVPCSEHNSLPPTQNHPAPNVSSAEVGKSALKECRKEKKGRVDSWEVFLT